MTLLLPRSLSNRADELHFLPATEAMEDKDCGRKMIPQACPIPRARSVSSVPQSRLLVKAHLAGRTQPPSPKKHLPLSQAPAQTGPMRAALPGTSCARVGLGLTHVTHPGQEEVRFQVTHAQALCHL